MPSGANNMQRYRRIDLTYQAVINKFNNVEQIYEVSGPIRIKLKKLASGQIVYF